MRHFVSTKSLSDKTIYSILNVAEQMRKNELKIPQQVFVTNLFFEPSTRTKMSFMAAQRKLGIETLDFQMEASSTIKGESLYDTAKTCEAIGANMLVIRHQNDNWYDDILPNINIPVINAGAGKGEHPTQCMLDLLTIYQEFGSFAGLKIVIAGDIKHSRVAHSNAYALTTLGAKVYFTTAPGFEDNTLNIPYVTMDDAAEMCDVMMLLRIQHERHATQPYDSTSYLEKHGMTVKREKRMKSHAIIMHPAPVNRGVEIDTGLVECERSRIFKQMGNGVYTRMAIMTNLLQEWGMQHEYFTEERKTSVI